MEKTLSRIGNSLALVVDKPLRAVLGISQRTRLKVWTDGKRLIVEPLQPPSVLEGVREPGAQEVGDERRLLIDAPHVMAALRYRRGMWQPQFDQLVHPKRRMHVLAYESWVEYGAEPEATAEDFTTMRRFEACLQAREAGQGWEEAIASALAKVPLLAPAVGGQ